MKGTETSASSPLDGPRAALMLLTRLPAGKTALSTAALRQAPVFFPLVGLLVGAIGAGLFHLVRPLAGSSIAALLTLVAMVLLTGALHEDGLADTADAWGGARGDRERLFAILKDSRHGTYGVLALCLSVGLRWECLDRLAPAAPGALLLSATLSRTFPVWLMAVLLYVTPPASASSRAAARTTTGHAGVATALAFAIALGLCALEICPPLLAGAAALAAALVTVLAGGSFRSRAGGITGDFLGATQQLTELTILLTFVVMA